MPRKITDLTGQAFSRLTVTSRAENDRYGKARWNCRCECGRDCIVLGRNLRSGWTRSCGCLQREAASVVLPGSEAAFNITVNSYRHNARVRGLDWSLDSDLATPLLTSPCHYCGAEPSSIKISQSGRGDPFVRNGIDRVNNARGYVDGNVVTCCSTCNYAKRDMEYGEFIAWIRRAAKHLVGSSQPRLSLPQAA